MIPLQTSDGLFLASFSERGLARLEFPTAGPAGADSAHVVPQTAAAVLRVPTAWIRAVRSAVACVLAGRDIEEMPPLDISAGTEFQQQVWEAMRTIPRGKTRSYGELASQVGRPRGAQAVGQACGANPIPLLIPCHRVLAAHGKLGGFSGGLDWKRRLLEREGTSFLF